MSINGISGFRLSVQQQRVWSQQAGNPPAYRAQCRVLLDGPLDAHRLREACRDVVSRHEILRTVFHHQPGFKFPFQVIREEPAFAWHTVDLSGLDAGEQRRAIEELASNVELNVENGPVLHIGLAALGPARHALSITVSSLCADPASLKNLVAAIGHLYASAASAGDADDVLQYAGVVEWQH